MKFLYIIFVILIFVSCDDNEFEVDSESQITVNVNGSSQTLFAKAIKGEGNEHYTRHLKEGIYLYNLNYTLSKDALNPRESAYVVLKNNLNKVISYISFAPESTDFKQLYIKEDGDYSLESFTPNDNDNWELTFIHESILSDSLRAKLISVEINEIKENDDKLFKYQWHLKNIGQYFPNTNFAPVAGNDINVTTVWDDGITGKGVSVAVVDEGVEVSHPDLIDNIDIASSWNFKNLEDGGKSHDTTPSDPNFAHGTAVAGIIAASWKNGIGGRGVAPEATLISYNMIEAQSITSFPIALDILVDKEDENVSIFNNSWGLVLEDEYADGDNNCSLHSLYPFYYILEPGEDKPGACQSDDIYCQFENQLKNGVKNGRDGKGYIYVKSAGNSRLCNENDDSSTIYMNSNYYPDQVERYMIVVGASKSDGYFSRYTTPGENVLLNAPGGSTQLAFLKPSQSMIVTTDLSSASKGYDFRLNNDGTLNTAHFNEDGNENYDYTDRMNGTSAAGPVVSGVVALMLEANPNLTWRDVKYILATTTTHNPDVSKYQSNGALLSSDTPSKVIAGHLYSPLYGFGRVNAGLAVEKARTWTNLPSEKVEVSFSSDINSTFGVVPAIGTASFTVSNDIEKIESVNIEFGIDSTINDFFEDKTITSTNRFSLIGGLYDVEFTIDGVEDDKTFVGGSNIDINVSVIGASDIDVIDELTLSGGSGAYTGQVNIPTKGNYQVLITKPSDRVYTKDGSFTLTLNRGFPVRTQNIKAELISPSLTTSIILDAPNYIKNSSDEFRIKKIRLNSNRFLDEDPQGIWQLKVTDMENNETRFTINNLRLEVYGH